MDLSFSKRFLDTNVVCTLSHVKFITLAFFRYVRLCMYIYTYVNIVRLFVSVVNVTITLRFTNSMQRVFKNNITLNPWSSFAASAGPCNFFIVMHSDFSYFVEVEPLELYFYFFPFPVTLEKTNWTFGYNNFSVYITRVVLFVRPFTVS